MTQRSRPWRSVDAEDLRIAELARAAVEHRVAARTDATCAPSRRSSRAPAPAARRRPRSCTRRRAADCTVGTGTGAEARRVPMVDDHRPREDLLPRAIRQRDRVLGPVQQVGARGVTPAHVAPVGALGVVLEEEVAEPVVEHQPVGVIHPVAWRGEVEPAAGTARWLTPDLLAVRSTSARRAGTRPRAGRPRAPPRGRAASARRRRRARSAAARPSRAAGAGGRR